LKKLKYRAKIELGIEYSFKSEYQKSLDFYKEALEISIEIENTALESEVYGAMGIVYKNQGEYADALVYYEKALETAIFLNDTSWIAACYANAGNVYRRLANYSKALDYFQRALEVFEQKGEVRRMAIANMNIGNLYEDQKDYAKALKYFSMALDLSYETEDNKRISECLMNCGNVFFAQGDLLSARQYYMKSVEINEKMGFTHILDDCYQSIGLTYEKEGNFENAIQYFNKSLTIARKETDRPNISESLAYLAEISIKKNDFNKAIQYAEESLEYSLFTKDPSNILNAYFYLSIGNEGVGNKEKALSYYKQYAAYKDTIFSTEKYKSVRDLEMKYETKQKEQQLEILKEKNAIQELMLSRRYWMFLGAMILMGLLAIIGYILIRNSHLKSRHNAILLEQKLLRSQMNPHFIFNSLIAIQSFIYKKEPVIAGDYLVKFADLIRITLDNSRNEFVLLSRELKMLEIYLELQSLRFENKFDFTIDIDTKIDPELVKVPPMLAQPFIENAIEHGLRYKKEKGLVKIVFSCIDDRIVFSVTDDGIGRDKARKLEINKKHESMATSITKDRLKVLSKKFKQNYKLELNDVNDKEGVATGTMVKLTIPFIKSK